MSALRKIQFSLLATFFLTFLANGQTVFTGCVRDTANRPVAGVSVYLSRTTIGTMSGKDGEYALSLDNQGEYELTASCIGYKPVSVRVISDGTRQKVNFLLPLSVVPLTEITVSAKDRDRGKKIRLFLDMFLGGSENADYCRLLNPGDLHLYIDPSESYLKGFSLKPLLIENRILGYSILYDLSDFNYDIPTGLLRFSGSSYFKQAEGKASSVRKWGKNRLRAYYGSRLDLLRAIVSDSLIENQFSLFSSETDSLTQEISKGRPMLARELIVSRKAGYAELYWPGPLVVQYTDTHSELENSLTGFRRTTSYSTISFSDTVRVWKNGYYNKPYGITWGGSMANERLAEMVPYDFGQTKDTVFADDDSYFGSLASNYLKKYRNGTATDQVYIHTDRNCYIPGDTVWFEGYIRNRFTGGYGSESKVLYVLIFNSAGAKADSARFRIENGLAPGWLVIKPDVVPGRYHLVAFTESMQNSDPDYSFQTDLTVRSALKNDLSLKLKLDKDSYRPGDTLVAAVRISDRNGSSFGSQKYRIALVSGGRPVSSLELTSAVNGEGISSFVIPDTLKIGPYIVITVPGSKNREELSGTFPCNFENPFFEFRFLPEGGNLVSGLMQKIGFSATDAAGKPIKIKGLLRNSEGQILDTLCSGKFGPGYFSCVPAKGMYVELTAGAGKEKIIPLPEPQQRGYVLGVKQNATGTVYIEVASSGSGGEKVYVNGTMNSTQVFGQELILDRKRGFTVNTRDLPAGVVEITLFNSSMMPVAARLIYVNPGKHLTFSFKTDKQKYRTGEETQLFVSATDDHGQPARGWFSVGVADSASGFDNTVFTPGIESALTCHPYLAGNLPSAVLEKGLENIAEDDLDLLFLVYGWSRFNWNFSKSVYPTSENYDLLDIKILYVSRNKKAGRRLDLVSLEGPAVIHLVSDRDGSIKLPLDSLPDFTRSVTLMPFATDKKKVNGAMLGIPYNEKYFASSKLLRIMPEVLPGYEKTKAREFTFTHADSIIEIPGVTIKGQAPPPKVYHDIYEEKYQYAHVMSLDYKLLWSAFTLEDAIRRLTYAYITEDGIYLRQNGSMFGSPIPALIVFNGQPLYNNGYDQVRTIDPSQLSSLTILKGERGYTQYGELAKGGVIFINTSIDNPQLARLRNEWKMQNTNNRMLIPIWLYRPVREFYNPAKIEAETDPAFRKYSTALWKALVNLDGIKPAILKYRNLQRTGPVKIVVNGISDTDLSGTGKSSYIVY
jgi:hypothetical protein